MRVASSLVAFTALIARTWAVAPYAGFTTFTQLTEGGDYSWVLPYTAPDRSNTLYVNVQILNDSSAHTQLFSDFTTLCKNYGAHSVNLIPRLRYGTPDGNVTPEPANSATVLKDVAAWANVVKATKQYCAIPLVQAGTLGLWGEWHDGPFCSQSGQAASATDKAVKLNITKTLLDVTGSKVGVRTPQDYAVLKASLNTDEQSRLTIHDDCILAEGPNGSDEGTFVDEDSRTAAQWRSYTISETGGRTFGGEPCQDTYSFSDVATVCSTGTNGLAAYITTMKIAYLNPLNPPALATLFHNTDSTSRQCIQRIQAALQANT